MHNTFNILEFMEREDPNLGPTITKGSLNSISGLQYFYSTHHNIIMHNIFNILEFMKREHPNLGRTITSGWQIIGVRIG